VHIDEPSQPTPALTIFEVRSASILTPLKKTH